MSTICVKSNDLDLTLVARKYWQTYKLNPFNLNIPEIYMFLIVVLRGAMDSGGNFCTSTQGAQQAKEAGSGSNSPTRRSQP